MLLSRWSQVWFLIRWFGSITVRYYRYKWVKVLRRVHRCGPNLAYRGYQRRWSLMRCQFLVLRWSTVAMGNDQNACLVLAKFRNVYKTGLILLPHAYYISDQRIKQPFKRSFPKKSSSGSMRVQLCQWIGSRSFTAISHRDPGLVVSDFFFQIEKEIRLWGVQPHILPATMSFPHPLRHQFSAAWSLCGLLLQSGEMKMVLPSASCIPWHITHLKVPLRHGITPLSNHNVQNDGVFSAVLV